MLRSAFPLALVASLAICAPAGAAGDPIMPLSEVRAGMQCTGYSVVRGTTVSSFAAAVEDVVSGDPAARSPRILVRVSGPAVDATGVGPGFSGSPIYCPGADGVPRVAGAISESVGEYGGRVVLATPIEAILGESPLPPLAARSDRAPLRAARPIATPLSVGGLSAPVARAVRSAAARARRVVSIVPAAPRAGFAPQPLVPGAAVAVGLASGDITASAIGTVAYADGASVWAFGHPLDAVGRRSLLLQDAYVYAVVNNPLSFEDAATYKLAAPGHDLGTLSSDGISAVVGRLGALPPLIPLRVLARDLDRGSQEVVDVALADERAVDLPAGGSALSALGPIAVAQAAYTALGAVPLRQSGSMCVRFELRERRRPLRFCNTYVGASGGGADLAAAGQVADVAAAAALIDAYDATPIQITKVEANLRLRRGLRQATMLGAAGPSVVRRGSVMRVKLRLRRPGAAAFTRTIRVRVPRSLPRGDYDLALVGTPLDGGEDGIAGDDFDITTLLDLGADGDAPAQAPATLEQLARAIAGLARYDGVTARFREPGADAEEDRGPGLRVHRDAQLRISGEATLPLTVVGARRGR